MSGILEVSSGVLAGLRTQLQKFPNQNSEVEASQLNSNSSAVSGVLERSPKRLVSEAIRTKSEVTLDGLSVVLGLLDVRSDVKR